MLPSSSVVKKTALTSMRGKWLNLSLVAVALCFVIIIGTLLSAVINEVLGKAFYLAFTVAFTVFISLPTVLGAFRFYRRAAWGENDSPIEIFAPFAEKKLYVRYMFLGFYMMVRYYAALIVLLIPSSIARLFSSASFYSKIGISMPSFAPSLSVIATILKVVAFVIAVVCNIKLYLLPFLMVSNDDISLRDAERLSLVMSNASVQDFMWLVFGMIHWILLSVLVLPMPFTLPYFFTCYTVHCRFCVSKYNEMADKVKNTAPSFNPKF